MTHDTPEPAPDFDPANMAKFFDATTLFFKRQLSPVEVVGRGGPPCFALSEAAWLEREADIKAKNRRNKRA